MTIAHDSVGSGTGTTTLTWEHTVVGTVRGITVYIIQNGGSAVNCTAVDCEGVAMTRVDAGEAFDTAGEPGGVQAWFLGGSIPSGNLTITATVSGTEAKFGVSVAVTADADTELAGTGSPGGTGYYAQDQNGAAMANPSGTVGSIAGASYGFAGLFHAANAPSGVTAGANATMRAQNDFGNQTGHVESRTTELASGDLTLGFTAASDDYAIVVVAIQEVAGGGAAAEAAIDSDLPALLTSATAVVVVEASIDSDLPAMLSAATAEVLSEATIASTLPALTQALAAENPLEAALAQDLPALTQSATVEAVLEAAIASALPALQQSVDVFAVVDGEADISSDLPALAQAVTAAVAIDASVAQALPAIQQSVTAQAPEPAAEASVDSDLPALRQRARVIRFNTGGGREGFVVWRQTDNPAKTKLRRNLPFRGGRFQP